MKLKINSDTILDKHVIIDQISLGYITILSLIVFQLSFLGCSSSSGFNDSYSHSTEILSQDTTYGLPNKSIAMGFDGLNEADDDNTNFTVVVLPDTQHYCEYSPGTYFAQTNWIVQNALSKNIKFVIHLGDVVDSSTIDQWRVADAAHRTLDINSIPYSVAIGNHDYETDADPERDSAKFNRYFGTSRFRGKSWYGGGYPSGKNDNSYYFFESGDLDFLVISLEYAPRKDSLSWAADIINSYPDHRVIIVTHGYLWTIDYSPRHANITTWYDLTGSDGTTLFNEFISRYSNIFLVIAGHCPGDSIRSIEANDGHIIYELLIDYQKESNGGNGWFKTLEFLPSDGAILMRSHTVAGNVSSFSGTEYYSSDPKDHTYKVSYDMDTMTEFSEDINPVGFNDRTINYTEQGDQTLPKVAGSPSGYFVAAWQDDSDDDGDYDVMIRGFTPDGTESFEEMIVNSSTSGTHAAPSVAVDPSGNAVVVWQDDSDQDGYCDIMMSGYAIDGTCRFSNYRVNADYYGRHVKPAVAMDASGKFVVVWQGDTDDNNFYQIYMKGFDENGLEYFSERAVEDTSAGQQRNPDVEVLSNGSFVIVWEDKDEDGFYNLYMKGFSLSSSATEYFSEREVDSVEYGQQFNPDICKLPDGNFVVAWEYDEDNNGCVEIYMSGFDSTGSRYFIQKAASSAGDSQQYYPAIASDGDGYFAVVWEDDLDSAQYIMMRAFNREAAEIMEQTIVNKDESGRHTNPSVTIGNEGRIVAVWTDDTDSDGYNNIVGRGAYDFGFERYYGD